jgi:hypothetical protein
VVPFGQPPVSMVVMGTMTAGTLTAAVVIVVENNSIL